MLASLRHLFRAAPAAALACVPAGERVYAIGDIHGRNDLFGAMIEAIEHDDSQRGPADTTVVLLGDLVDRGPDSSGVIGTARNWQIGRKVRILAGNHEEMFLEAFDDKHVLRQFLRHGGRETVLSYPIDLQAYNDSDLGQAQDLMRAAVPEGDLAFMRGFEDAISIGDYVFVHAGIVPGVPIEDQDLSDLRWIRQPFLDHLGDHGQIVVHGHTIFDTADIRSNRIGIDTGAFASGLLTALCLEGTARWLIEVREDEGAIAWTSRPV